jgi:hypothetical protein
MENNSRLKWISEQLKELDQLILKFQESPQQIYRIDTDLILEKVRRLYESMTLIEVQNAASIPEVKEEVQVRKEILQEESIPEVPDKAGIEITDHETASPVPNHVEEEKVVLKDEEVKETPPALIDLFSTTAPPVKATGTKTTDEEKVVQKPVEILADKFGKKKIAGLNQAIGINEKFFFINELFEGNMKEYKNAIEKLDQSENPATAIETLEQLANSNGWDKSKEAFTMLLDFIERKFN